MLIGIIFFIWFTACITISGICASIWEFKIEDKLSGARTACSFGFITFIGFIWCLQAVHTWPYKDVVRTVEIHNGRAYLYKEKEDVRYIKNTENELVPFEEEKYANLNFYFERQFKDGEKLKLRMYEPKHMWLSGWIGYEIFSED